ncbi:MAG: Rid family detoxifying hydrolase [bacterium]
MKIIKTDKLPAPAGSYSPAVSSGSMIYISGQLAIDTDSGEMSQGRIADQTMIIMDNITGFLNEQKLGAESIVKVSVYMTDLSLFSEFDRVYARYFENGYPARVVAGVKALPKDALIEMEVTVESGS